MNGNNTQIKLIVCTLLFILSIFLIGQNLNKPFWGEHDWNGVRYGNIARNYLKYGLIETKLGQVENSGLVRTEKFEYYTHYPPLLPILIAASYKLFGISEWTTRLVPLLATSGIIVLIFLIGTSIWDFKIGLLASILALATPMVLYFGKNPVHEPLVLFFILLSFFGYLKYHPLFLIGLILAEMTAWAGYFLLPAITIPLIIKKDWLGIRRLFPYWILSIVLFFLHFIHVTILTGSASGGNLIGSLLQRSGLLSDVQPSGFSLFGYLDRLRLWFSILYTITLTALALSWTLIKRVKFENKDLPILSLGLVGLIYALAFSSSVFIHNYLIFYFLPFLVLLSSQVIVFIANFKIFRYIKITLPIIFISLVFFERRDYLLALNESKADKLAADIGITINKTTLASDKIVVSPHKFSYSAENFLKFYSDRYLIFADNPSEYDVLVIVDQNNNSFTIKKKYD